MGLVQEAIPEAPGEIQPKKVGEEAKPGPRAHLPMKRNPGHMSLVFTCKGETYVWPRGNYVQVYDFEAYVRRLSGELTQCRPKRVIRTESFASREAFRAWYKLRQQFAFDIPEGRGCDQ